MRAVVAFLTLVFAASFARAQPSTIEPAPVPATTKRPEIATTLAIVGTLAPVGLMASGDETLIVGGALASFVTPSLGHWYAGKIATTGIALRGVGLGAMVAGFAISPSDCPLLSESDCEGGGFSAGLLVAGFGLYVGGAIYDIATAHRAANTWNEHHAVRVAPTLVPTPSGPSAGVGISGTF